MQNWNSRNRALQLPSEQKRAELNLLLVGCHEIDRLLTTASCGKSKNINYSVSIATGHEEAMRVIESKQFDACLVNFDLAGKTGLDLVRDAAEAKHGLPFILLTDRDDHRIDAEAMASGVVDYFVKDQVTAPLLRRAIRYGIERKRTESRLAALADFDELTGLANRTHFHRMLRHEIAVANRTGRQLAIFFLDLDRFKRVNDDMGHMMGDHLLRKVADCLRDCCRETDTVARLGGDEFAIVATHIEDGGGAEVVANKILAALSEPFMIVGHNVHTSSSIGISLYPSDEDNIERLLANADMAMYRAKAEGGNTYRYFDANLSEEIKRKRSMGRAMRQALDHGDFTAHYQPVFDVTGGQVIGAEALARWRPDGEGYISPSEFIPIAESDGLIDRLGERMLLTACKDCMAWQGQGLKDVGVAVNVSPSQFKRSGIVEIVLRTLQDSRLDPTLLELELTENTVMRDFEEAAEALQRLRDEGVRIAIDDFGTGYSSLAYLKHLPVDRLKIDQSFIAGVENQFGDRAITRAVIRLGNGLGIDVTAEGVENAGQLKFLNSKKCSSVQGYFLAKPMPLETFVEAVRGRNVLSGAA
jgi:diguanylate cyclase (GGDEF)-like protein|tara:strand:- start:242 stop:2002 length:1761 start_codon:yes stop_codon:yes gene_type:complete